MKDKGLMARVEAAALAARWGEVRAFLHGVPPPQRERLFCLALGQRHWPAVLMLFLQGSGTRRLHVTVMLALRHQAFSFLRDAVYQRACVFHPRLLHAVLRALAYRQLWDLLLALGPRLPHAAALALFDSVVTMPLPSGRDRSRRREGGADSAAAADSNFPKTDKRSKGDLNPGTRPATAAAGCGPGRKRSFSDHCADDTFDCTWTYNTSAKRWIYIFTAFFHDHRLKDVLTEPDDLTEDPKDLQDAKRFKVTVPLDSARKWTAFDKLLTEYTDLRNNYTGCVLIEHIDICPDDIQDRFFNFLLDNRFYFTAFAILHKKIHTLSVLTKKVENFRAGLERKKLFLMKTTLRREEPRVERWAKVLYERMLKRWDLNLITRLKDLQTLPADAVSRILRSLAPIVRSQIDRFLSRDIFDSYGVNSLTRLFTKLASENHQDPIALLLETCGCLSTLNSRL